MEEGQRVCVLTGASGKLGSALIERFSSLYRIMAVYHRSYPTTTVVDWFKADLSVEEEIDRLVTTAVWNYGRVDLLINAAVCSRWRPLLEPNSLRDVEQQFAVNVLAPLRLAKGFAEVYWSQRADNVVTNRNIVNVSSTAGTRVYPNFSQVTYSATKAALNFASQHVANEFQGMGVRVNTVAPTSFPGLVSTEAVVDAISYLDSSRDTGRLLVLDV
jgi:NAD(P)-dependent dehydrogenase (short-subunit alcohol dehydrogenase family)